MIFLTLYIIGVAIAWLLIALQNDNVTATKDKETVMWCIFSWIIVFIVLFLIFVSYEPSLKPIKNLYKRIFKQ